MKNNHTGALLAAGRALLLMVALGMGGGGMRAQDFNPENPGNPGEPTITTYYTLTTSVSPATAGSSSPTSKSLAEGGTTTVYATANSNYTFVKWTSADTVVSTSRSFTYTMPAEDVELTAVFTFDPSAPDNPDEPTITTYYTLTTSVSPATAGSSSPTSKSLAEGGTTTVYATANSNYTFVKWTSADTVVSTSRSFTYTMPAEDVELTAVFTFDPSAPDNPGANYYDSGTGEVIVDDFEAGSLASAIDEVIGGSSYRSKVTQVTVSGEMASGDFSFVDNLTNCTYADLSRAYGFTAIPNRAFDGTNLSSIVLPSVVESIGNYAFRDCEQLTSVSLYAVTPPTLGTDVFDGIPDGLVVYVPAVAVSIYADDEDWGVYTILPLEEDVYELTVNLPDDASDGRYKDMTLELINTASGQRYKYVITDRTAYTFNSLMSGTTYNVYVKNASSSVLGTLTDVAIGEADVEVSFESLLQPHDVSLTLLTPDGSDVTDQATIAWYDASGNYLKQASSLTGQIEESTLSYTVSLPQALALVYATPESGAHTVASSGNSLTLTLEAFTETTLTGYVADSSTGNAISGATVTVSQLLNNKYTKTFTTTTDSKGAFTLTPLALTSTLTVSATDYVAQTIDSLALDTLTDAGTIALSSITGARITTNYTYTESAAEGSEATTQDWYTDYANVAYSLYNVSTQQDITQFSVQYPQVVLLEDVAEGDVLRLTASSRKGAFEDVAVECTISNNAATVTIPIVQLGQISATFTSTDNAAVVGILYNAAGQYQKCYTYTNAQLSITDLADGNYTLVSMGSSSLFNSIMLLSQYAEAGLTDGTHYVQSPVSVQSGVISEVTISEVPLLDESTFTFTGDGTYFTVNKTSITSGNYLTLKGRIDFLDEYADAVEDVSLVVDLPDECSFVESSVMVGTSLTGYTVEDGSRITIPISNLSDYARFCIIPTLGGDYAPSAYAAFTLGGTEVLQPIGNAAFSVNDLSITVPSVVAKTSVAISGTATGNSAVTIYDGDAIIGSTTTLANGSWNATCELNNPYNLSTHDICAKVVTMQGLELQSETEQVQYDANAVMVSKVSMYHDNPETKKTYEIVYDFINPSSSSQYYIYYIYNKVFTFTIEFTNNSPDVVDDVVLYVKTGTGNQVALEAAYDSIQDLWVTSGEFGNKYDGDIPVNVSVGFDFLSETLADTAAYYAVFSSEYAGASVEWTSISEGLNTFTVTPSDATMAYKCIYLNLPVSGSDDLVSTLESISYTEAEFCETQRSYYVSSGNDSYVMILSDADSVSLLGVFDVEDSLECYTLLDALSGSTELNGGAAVRKKAFFYEPGASEIRASTDALNRWRDAMIQEAIDMTNEKLSCADDETNILLHTAVNRLRQCVGFSMGSFLTLLVSGTPTDAGSSPFVIGNLISFGDGGMEGLSRAAREALDYIRNAPSCGGGGNNRHDSGNPDTSYGLDPSGYVYEGVSSNRLEGVTATCYYKETLEDMYGDVYEVVDIWDAAAYAQENPLFTDENGMYRWDVPEGLWQVKFEKDGYVTAYSEWLPVPPPQLDVNIAMTQNLQPDVLSATAYEEGIEIVFDKYMTPETMTTEYIYAVVNEEGVEGSVVLLDEEASYEGSGDTYVSRVRFVPTEAFTAGSEVTLVVSRKVSSYAGLSMQSDFTQVFDVEQEVASIEVDSVLNVSYGGTKTFIVQALPASAAAGRCLVVGVSSSKIATASVDSIVLDEYGQALITLSGVLPGTTAATFSIVGSSVVGSATVQVESASNFTAEPVASRASGTAVYYGATVALTCDTENAVIYYTTDGTCPCDASGSRQVYSEPIVITEALTIRALAVAEGMYESDVVAFSYTVIEPSDVEVTIYNPGYATLYYGDRALQVPEGLDAYTVTAADSLSATLTPIADGIIPAKTGVVLKTAADAYEGSTNPEDYLMYTLTLVDDAESVEAVSGNLLVGTDEAIAITLSSELCYYTLSLSDPEDVTTIGFQALADTLLTFTNPAHEAFLPLANDLGAVLSLVIDDGNDTGDGGDEQDDPTTDLSRISADDESHCIYTITGIRLTESINALPPGLYIVDGRRVYITNKHIH